MTTITEEINTRLARIEVEENVIILYACESGSRAWGFASKNSDWDVRFIYIRPRDWYLSVNMERMRDVIELPITDDLDINGWDIRKALWLFRKSNPPLSEWFRSPIVYLEQTSFIERVRKMLPTYYSFRTCHYHYLNIALRQYRRYLHGKKVVFKKYFYVLRPLLAVKWMEQGRGQVPVRFDELLPVLDDAVLTKEIQALVAKKSQGDELSSGLKIDILNQFIDVELERLEGMAPPGVAHSELEPLNDIFRSVLDEAWKNDL